MGEDIAIDVRIRVADDDTVSVINAVIAVTIHEFHVASLEENLITSLVKLI